ncbi:MAG: hypothetical protein M3Q18_05595, partial [Actinomycetota bacterium]|nr:hypothetical protein [Actinomycetota bacterium]
AEQAADTAKQAGGSAQTPESSGNITKRASRDATGMAEQAGDSARSPENFGNITKGASTDATGTAGPGFSQDSFPMPGTRRGDAPAAARVASGVFLGMAHSWNRSGGNDSDQPLKSPSQLMAEVVQAGNQITSGAPRNKEAEQFDFTEWLPGWLPSLLAFTGFSALLLTGIAVFFINSGAAALAWSRRGGRRAPDPAMATAVVSP